MVYAIGWLIGFMGFAIIAAFPVMLVAWLFARER